MYLLLGLGILLMFGAVATVGIAWLAISSIGWAVAQVPELKNTIPTNWSWAWVEQVPQTLFSQGCWGPLKSFAWNSAVLEAPPALAELETLVKNCLPKAAAVTPSQSL